MAGFTMTLGSSGSASVDAELARMARTVAALDADLKREIASRADEEIVRPLVAQMRARGSGLGRQPAVVARSLTTRAGNPPAIRAGGGGLPGAVVYGAEFGAGRSRTATYTAVGRTGRRWLVRGRHSTHQFLPHRGQEGYFMYPVLRANVQQTMTRWLDLADEVLGKALR